MSTFPIASQFEPTRRPTYFAHRYIQKYPRIYCTDNIYVNKTMALRIALVLTIMATFVTAQRPFYAGLKPIGYPQVESDFLANRFGSNEPGPIEFQGDPNYRNRVQQLPQDQQPFWYLNWKQYDDLRKNPKTYPQRPSIFNNNINK